MATAKVPTAMDKMMPQEFHCIDTVLAQARHEDSAAHKLAFTEDAAVEAAVRTSAIAKALSSITNPATAVPERHSQVHAKEGRVCSCGNTLREGSDFCRTCGRENETASDLFGFMKVLAARAEPVSAQCKTPPGGRANHSEGQLLFPSPAHVVLVERPSCDSNIIDRPRSDATEIGVPQSKVKPSYCFTDDRRKSVSLPIDSFFCMRHTGTEKDGFTIDCGGCMRRTETERDLFL